MIRKTMRTIDVYERAGGLLRLFKAVGMRTACDANNILYKDGMDKITKALELIDSVCDMAEENMFNDYPELSRDYLDVFYGTFTDGVKNKVDLKVRKNARRSADELFARKSD